MRVVDCPNFCETCPIREKINGEPKLMGELGYVAEGVISEGGRVASIEIRYGVPVTERTSTIGIANADGRTGFTFKALGSAWDRGDVEEAFEECTEPVEKRTGFLHLRKVVVCSALEGIS
jgi:hypothetical protein